MMKSRHHLVILKVLLYCATQHDLNKQYNDIKVFDGINKQKRKQCFPTYRLIADPDAVNKVIMFGFG